MSGNVSLKELFVVFWKTIVFSVLCSLARVNNVLSPLGTTRGMSHHVIVILHVFLFFQDYMHHLTHMHIGS